MAAPEVRNFDVRSYGDWNRVQDVIESKRWWAILHIYPFAHEGEQWEVWVDGDKYATRDTFREAMDAMDRAEEEHGFRGR